MMTKIATTTVGMTVVILSGFNTMTMMVAMMKMKVKCGDNDSGSANDNGGVIAKRKGWVYGDRDDTSRKVGFKRC